MIVDIVQLKYSMHGYINKKVEKQCNNCIFSTEALLSKHKQVTI